MKLIYQGKGVGIRAETLAEVAELLEFLESRKTQQQARPAVVKKQRRRHIPTNCGICGKKVRGLKLHIRLAHKHVFNLAPQISTPNY